MLPDTVSVPPTDWLPVTTEVSTVDEVAKKLVAKMLVPNILLKRCA